MFSPVFVAVGLVLVTACANVSNMMLARDCASPRAIDRELIPEALQEVFRRVVPDPQLFEALPLSEMRELQV